MGHSASVIAVNGSRVDSRIGAFGLMCNNTLDPDNKSPLSGGSCRNLFLVWRNWRPHDPFKDFDLLRVSATVPLQTFDVCEATSFAGLRGFDAGKPIWTVEAAEGDGTPLTMTGPVPPDVIAAAQDARGSEDGDFEVPVRAFGRLTGFRYDTTTGVPFAVLQQVTPPKRPFWKFWR